jgi:hypothetical protein
MKFSKLEIPLTEKTVNECDINLHFTEDFFAALRHRVLWKFGVKPTIYCVLVLTEKLKGFKLLEDLTPQF